jgi:hypothetical protein
MKELEKKLDYIIEKTDYSIASINKRLDNIENKINKKSQRKTTVKKQKKSYIKIRKDYMKALANQDIKPLEVLILTVIEQKIRENKNKEDYTIYPLTEIAKDLGVSRKAVIYSMKNLREQGFLQTKKSVGKPNKIFISELWV